MKIELHESTKPIDALNDALAVMSYQRFLLAETLGAIADRLR